MKKLVFTVGTLLAVMSAYAQTNVIVTNSVTGNGNTSSITQTMQAVYGADNKASVTIMGNSNSAKLKQTGGGLVSTTTQSGNTNESDVTQVGAYSANSESQTATNGATNKSVVTSNGQGIVSQVYQQADGAGSGNDMMLDQTGNNSYLGSQQKATAGGKNKVDWKQTGYDAIRNIGSKATIDQTANGMGSMNTLTGTQNVDVAGLSFGNLAQNASAGGVNEGTVNQTGTYADAELIQFASGIGSKNTATFNQNGTDNGVASTTSAFASQQANAGGVNVATATQNGKFQVVNIGQNATGMGSKNTATVTESDDQHQANITQAANAGGTNDATVLQAKDGSGLSGSLTVVTQRAIGMNSKNMADVKQYGGDYLGAGGDMYVNADQKAFGGGQNATTIVQGLPNGGSNNYNNLAQTVQYAEDANSKNTAIINQEGISSTIGLSQTALTGGKNVATLNQGGLGGADNYNQIQVTQVAVTGGMNNATVDQKGIFFGAVNDLTTIKQGITSGGAINNATVTQERNGYKDLAYIEQGASGTGSENTAILKQSTTASVLGIGNDAAIYQTATGGGKNKATVTQDGDNYARVDQRADAPGLNEATITQVGFGDRATANQLGTGNMINQTQTGNNDISIINQTGVGNMGSTTQTGNNDVIGLTQTGNGNKADITQTGDMNSITFNQIGNGNMATITQVGNGLMGGVTTVTGNNNTTIISQN